MSNVTGYRLVSYGDMITDGPRMDAYAQALRQAVTPESTVLDIGAGTGIFSLLACQLGARLVHAIEPNDAIVVAQLIATANNKKIGKPPALPVDSQSLTITGKRGKSHNSEPLKVQEKETSNVRRTRFKPHEVGMQVSHCMDTEVSQEGDI